ncbi:MAG: amidohydrolase [Halothermotrichaceae bacterium]
MDKKNLKEKIINYRRDIHKYAESRWREFRTTAKIVRELKQLGFDIKMGKEIIEPSKCVGRPPEEQIKKEEKRAIKQGAEPEIIDKLKGYTGVVATWDTKKKGPQVAFRFDIDALDGEESKDEDHRPLKKGFKSVNNATHSCGHDGHTAIGLGLAHLIKENSDKLNGKIVLIFQPSEEGGSGAEAMLAGGVEADFDSFYALHLSLIYKDGKSMPTGLIAGGCNDFLDNRRYDVYFEGKSAHPGGAAQKGKNALLAACNAALNLHAIAPHDDGLMRVNAGQLNAGVARNVIAPEAKLVIEARGENDDIAEYVERRSREVIKGAAAMYDVEYTMEPMGITPSASSDEEAIAQVEKAVSEIDEFTDFIPLGNVGGSDDAASWMRKVQKNGGKATYIGIGADSTASLHNNKFDFDESVLYPASEMLFRLIKLSKK